MIASRRCPPIRGFWLVSQPPFSLVRGHFYVMGRPVGTRPIGGSGVRRHPRIALQETVLSVGDDGEDQPRTRKNEEIVKSSCDALPHLFNVVTTFGGKEVIDYPRDAELRLR